MTAWGAGTARAIAGLGVLAALAGAMGCGSTRNSSSDSGQSLDGAMVTCKDDRAPAGTPFVQGGQSCTLPDGGAGVGSGKHGCVDPNACHCTPQAGSATCDPGGVCVYAACSGVNQGQACALAGDKRGSCCKGACVANLDT